jgi:hypothetical protein
MDNRQKIATFNEALQQNEDFKNVKEFFPHLAKKIEILSGDNILSNFLSDLMLDVRGGTRQGFSKPIAASFLKINLLHESFFKEELTKQRDTSLSDKQNLWGNSNSREFKQDKGIDFTF